MTSRRGRMSGSGGFTMVELIIAIVVIAVLAAILIPTILGQVERARISDAMEQVNQTAITFKRFFEDTGYWPYGNTVWNPNPNGSPSVAPTSFSTGDTTLFANIAPTVTPPLLPCSQVNAGMSCWNGPYLGRGSSMADPNMIDPWGDVLLYTMQRPFDGFGGGTQYAPNGIVVVWSAGPNMADETGCTTVNNAVNGQISPTGCTLSYACIVAGCAGGCAMNSGGTGAQIPCTYPGASPDDIIKVSGTAK